MAPRFLPRRLLIAAASVALASGVVLPPSGALAAQGSCCSAVGAVGAVPVVSWTETVDPPSGIKANVPGDPTASSDEGKGDTPAMRTYTTLTVDGFYQFGVVDFPDASPTDLVSLVGGMRSAMEEEHGKAPTVSQEETTFDGRPALDVRLAVGSVVELVRAISTDEYIVSVQSEGTNTNEPALKATHIQFRDSVSIPEGD